MLRFVTTNAEKAAEAQAHLAPMAVEQVDYDYVEVQAAEVAQVAARGAEEAYEKADGEGPVIVDDTGFSIRGLDGFPGPYAAYVDDTLGIERVWSLASELADRHAAFTSAIAYADGDRVEVFEGTVEGQLVAPRGEGGFGYDPIFEYEGRTFAELSMDEKNEISHRARALSKLADWLQSQPIS
ncbi:deoxyribonucleotide triphosphate pyrophosphatase [Halodesulfurarchaeum formicicum]|uniref:Deoxyribonucleotide triphosphate pyrophosphatase n=1 Tax=Halodesulfurarchaeum formicicum TaxID=1873524 RepID=A0A1D8S6U8_9EURY|nr:RdgB/HAM1 family non-canonical purine NTP pyrophosphatase [Halodesulfurarchaeum formicicum]AOW81086.1 deoxyribonucleotide triphosphate pyrophosphatase [Halodesulfurarchaeum formicicum]APE96422.1 XTP/dITP diphosphohydrolase [Halodesulfurarchaeum formicicum]